MLLSPSMEFYTIPNIINVHFQLLLNIGVASRFQAATFRRRRRRAQRRV